MSDERDERERERYLETMSMTGASRFQPGDRPCLPHVRDVKDARCDTRDESDERLDEKSEEDEKRLDEKVE